jgi:hypothetical protein
MKEQLMIIIIGIAHLDFNLIELSKRLKYFEIEIKSFPNNFRWHASYISRICKTARCLGGSTKSKIWNSIFLYFMPKKKDQVREHSLFSFDIYHGQETFKSHCIDIKL